ncbi:MAG: hypothetical protein EXR75_03325 [Myxococcales bacterium]|nr:hypothetical protein [Myxococcales bacterium]
MVTALACLTVGGAGFAALTFAARFPPDTTPEGAYRRIAHSLSHDEPEDVFPYLEEAAAHALFTLHGVARQIVEAVRADFPESARTRELARYEHLAAPVAPPALWVHLAQERGWLRQLRRDLSGIDHVERSGERATVVTARGTRYSLRVRPNGIWGLSAFTALLEADARRLSRDWELVRNAAHDYRAGTTPVAAPPGPAPTDPAAN